MPWLKHPYKISVSPQGLYLFFPFIDVSLSHKGKPFPQLSLALVDSGCTTTNINAEIATFFGIDLIKDCKELSQTGSMGKGSAYLYNSTITMSIKDHGAPFESPAIFVKDLAVPILLGQDNFFEMFKVKFEKHNKVFELNRVF